MKRLTTIILSLAALSLCACQHDRDELPVDDGPATIVLSLADAQVFTELHTRAEMPVADLSKYSFTLSGTTISGAVVTDLVLDVAADGTAQVNAGTYTLTADNLGEANRGNGRPWYRGTSEAFSIDVNETQSVAITLGKPKNARLTMAVDESFSSLYESPVLTLSDGERSITLHSTEEDCYFVIPASGALAYTITASALAGSHATDMPQSTGYVDVQAGYNTTITLKANPATGVIIPVADGNYSGTFD